MYVAALHGRLDLIRILVEGGASLNCTSTGRSAVFQLLHRGKTQALRAAFTGWDWQAADRRDRKDFAAGAVRSAAAHERLGDIRRLLRARASVEDRDQWGQSALALAAKCGRLQSMKLLVERMAQLESQDDLGRTPLMQAASEGRVVGISYLAEVKADVNAFDMSGHSAIHRLVMDKKAFRLDRTLKLLLESGSRLDCRNKDGQTPAMLAASRGRVDVLTILIELKADLALVDVNGFSALHHATPVAVQFLTGHDDWLHAAKQGHHALKCTAAPAGPIPVLQYLLWPISERGAVEATGPLWEPILAVIQNLATLQRCTAMSPEDEKFLDGLVSIAKLDQGLESRHQDVKTAIQRIQEDFLGAAKARRHILFEELSGVLPDEEKRWPHNPNPLAFLIGPTGPNAPQVVLTEHINQTQALPAVAWQWLDKVCDPRIVQLAPPALPGRIFWATEPHGFESGWGATLSGTGVDVLDRRPPRTDPQEIRTDYVIAPVPGIPDGFCLKRDISGQPFVVCPEPSKGIVDVEVRQVKLRVPRQAGGTIFASDIAIRTGDFVYMYKGDIKAIAGVVDNSRVDANQMGCFQTSLVTGMRGNQGMHLLYYPDGPRLVVQNAMAMSEVLVRLSTNRHLRGRPGTLFWTAQPHGFNVGDRVRVEATGEDDLDGSFFTVDPAEGRNDAFRLRRTGPGGLLRRAEYVTGHTPHKGRVVLKDPVRGGAFVDLRRAHWPLQRLGVAADETALVRFARERRMTTDARFWSTIAGVILEIHAKIVAPHFRTFLHSQFPDVPVLLATQTQRDMRRELESTNPEMSNDDTVCASSSLRLAYMQCTGVLRAKLEFSSPAQWGTAIKKLLSGSGTGKPRFEVWKIQNEYHSSRGLGLSKGLVATGVFVSGASIPSPGDGSGTTTKDWPLNMVVEISLVDRELAGLERGLARCRRVCGLSASPPASSSRKGRSPRRLYTYGSGSGGLGTGSSWRSPQGPGWSPGPSVGQPSPALVQDPAPEPRPANVWNPEDDVLPGQGHVSDGDSDTGVVRQQLTTNTSDGHHDGKCVAHGEGLRRVSMDGLEDVWSVASTDESAAHAAAAVFTASALSSAALAAADIAVTSRPMSIESVGGRQESSPVPRESPAWRTMTGAEPTGPT